MKKIGFIGLGIMGKPMSRNLLKAGYRLVIFDIDGRVMEELQQSGMEAAASPKEVARQADTIITMLPDSPQVREAMLGKDGVIEGARKGSIVVDMSSIAPATSRELAAALAARSIRMLDAPVSGGEPKAIDGTLSIMVGGAQTDFEEMLPVFRAMGASAVLIGGIGAGNVAKLANQIIVQINIAAVSEALVMAAKAGVEPNLVFQAIRGGLAGSTVLEAKAPMIMDRQFQPGGRIHTNIKDLRNALEAGHEVGSPLPLTAAVMELMQVLKADGMADLDHGAIVRFYERLAHVEVTR